MGRLSRAKLDARFPERIVVRNAIKEVNEKIREMKKVKCSTSQWKLHALKQDARVLHWMSFLLHFPLFNNKHINADVIPPENANVLNANVLKACYGDCKIAYDSLPKELQEKFARMRWGIVSIVMSNQWQKHGTNVERIAKREFLKLKKDLK